MGAQTIIRSPRVSNTPFSSISKQLAALIWRVGWRAFSIATLTGLLLFSTISSRSFAEDQASYRISADDQISVTLFGEPDLSLTKIRIAANGTISMPLIGQVQVNGLTAAELEVKLTKLFAEGYLKNPVVTVSIVEYRLFYINGEVHKPGGYSYRDGLTVQSAVALAGGFTERASKSKINIAHEENKNETFRVELTSPVRPGDIITVEESFF